MVEREIPGNQTNVAYSGNDSVIRFLPSREEGRRVWYKEGASVEIPKDHPLQDVSSPAAIPPHEQTTSAK